MNYKFLGKDLLVSEFSGWMSFDGEIEGETITDVDRAYETLEFLLKNDDKNIILPPFMIHNPNGKYIFSYICEGWEQLREDDYEILFKSDSLKEIVKVFRVLQSQLHLILEFRNLLIDTKTRSKFRVVPFLDKYEKEKLSRFSSFIFNIFPEKKLYIKWQNETVKYYDQAVPDYDDKNIYYYGDCYLPTKNHNLKNLSRLWYREKEKIKNDNYFENFEEDSCWEYVSKIIEYHILNKNFKETKEVFMRTWIGLKSNFDVILRFITLSIVIILDNYLEKYVFISAELIKMLYSEDVDVYTFLAVFYFLCKMECSTVLPIVQEYLTLKNAHWEEGDKTKRGIFTNILKNNRENFISRYGSADHEPEYVKNLMEDIPVSSDMRDVSSKLSNFYFSLKTKSTISAIYYYETYLSEYFIEERKILDKKFVKVLNKFFKKVHGEELDDFFEIMLNYGLVFFSQSRTSFICHLIRLACLQPQIKNQEEIDQVRNNAKLLKEKLKLKRYYKKKTPYREEEIKSIYEEIFD